MERTGVGNGSPRTKREVSLEESEREGEDRFELSRCCC